MSTSISSSVRTRGSWSCTADSDLSTAPTLEAELSAATAAEGPTVVVDLDRVTFMDSTGLQVLLKYLLRLPVRLRVTKGSPEVQLLFEVSGVGEQLEFWDPETP